MQRITKENGISFSYIPNDKFKTNYFQVCFICDLDRKNTTNLSLLSGVLLRASEKYPSIAKISDRLDYLYDMNVSLNSFKRGERLVLAYDCDFIKNEFLPSGEENLLLEALEMFKELVFNPYLTNGVFDGKILESEKKELENAIKSVINHKSAYARKRCTQVLCEGEKYALDAKGELEDIGKITPESLYDFYRNFIKTARIEIFFCGNANFEKVADKFENIILSATERNPIKLGKTYVTGEVKHEIEEVCEEMEINQGNLAMGFRTGVEINDDDCTALSLFCEILGGSPTSKLFMNVREKMSLCYYCRSLTDSYKGIMLILSGIESKNKKEAFDAIMREIDDIQNGKITDDEFEAAKLSLINSYKTLDDSPSSICTWFMSRIICDNFDTPSDVVNTLLSISVSDVVKVSKKVKLDTVYFLKGNEKVGEAE